MFVSGALRFHEFCGKNREPTSGLEPLTCSLRVIIHVLQGFALVCESRTSKRFSLVRLALCCTVLRSRWCQSGINKGIAPSRSCSLKWDLTIMLLSIHLGTAVRASTTPTGVQRARGGSLTRKAMEQTSTEEARTTGTAVRALVSGGLQVVVVDGHGSCPNTSDLSKGDCAMRTWSTLIGEERLIGRLQRL